MKNLSLIRVRNWDSCGLSVADKKNIKDTLNSHGYAKCRSQSALPVLETRVENGRTITVCLFGKFVIEFYCEPAEQKVTVTRLQYRTVQERYAAYESNPALLNGKFVARRDLQ